MGREVGKAGPFDPLQYMNICSYMNEIDPAALERLTDIFRVLGDPTRLRILDALSRGERCVGDLAARLGVTESAVSHQLRLLRGARLVRARRDGRMIFYFLHDTHVLTLFDQALRHVQEPSQVQPAAAPPPESAHPAAPASAARTSGPVTPAGVPTRARSGGGGVR